ncbi:MAG: PQQ-binding-like beta-propeller repeat protein [Vicinamibacterales bacterium]
MARRLVATLVAAALASVAPSTQSRFDYTQWRGEDRSGAASAFVALKTWPERLLRKWTVNVGEGYATPLLAGSTLYTFVRDGGQEVLIALDPRTGRQRWRSGYDAPYTASKPAAAHGAWPKATPLIMGGSVFTVGISGIVSAFNGRNGRLLWQTDAPGESPFYGAAASPAGHAGLVLAHPGNYGPLTAFDASTGAVRWTSEGRGFYGSPVIAELAGVRQAVTMLLDSVVGVSLDTGETLWKFPCDAGGGAVTPLFHEGLVIVAGLQIGLVAVRPARHDGRWTTEKVWDTNDVNAYVSTPVVSGGKVFGLSHRNSGQFYALDARTGTLLWSGPPRSATNSAVVAAGPWMVLLNDDGEMLVLDPRASRFDPVRRYTVADGATWAQPLISGNRVFVKDALSLSLWEIP